MTEPNGSEATTGSDVSDRRQFFSKATTVAMGAGLAAAYGTFGVYAGRFLYPAKAPPVEWRLVAPVTRLKVGESLVYRTPAGAPVAIARVAEKGDAADFIALSSTCPHLGCQVHWEAQNNRFFCPCHNGVFTPEGKGVGGPPGDAGQDLPRYDLKIEDGLLYIAVPEGGVTVAQAESDKGECIEEPHRGPQGPGHDPCLMG